MSTSKAEYFERYKPLIRAFVEMECYELKESPEWTDKIMELIHTKILSLKGKAVGYITINSRGNVGCLIRALKLDFCCATCEGDIERDYEIELCPCGKLNHTAFLNVKRDD
jgi:hypothetical protein